MTDRRTDDQPRFRTLASGATQDLTTGRIVANPNGGRYAITPDRGRELQQRQRQQYLRSHLRGLAIGAGIDVAPGAEDEDILNAATNAVELVTAHMTRQFLQSENIRGMGETFSKLIAPLTAGPPEDDTQAEERAKAYAWQRIVAAARQIDRERRAALEQGVIIDAKEVE